MRKRRPDATIQDDPLSGQLAAIEVKNRTERHQETGHWSLRDNAPAGASGHIIGLDFTQLLKTSSTSSPATRHCNSAQPHILRCTSVHSVSFTSSRVRQIYRIESLYPPTLLLTAAVLRDMIKRTQCINHPSGRQWRFSNKIVGNVFSG